MSGVQKSIELKNDKSADRVRGEPDPQAAPRGSGAVPAGPLGAAPADPDRGTGQKL